MKLATKLKVFAACATTVSALGLSGIVIFLNYSAGIGQLNQRLDTVAMQSLRTSGDPISNSMVLAQNNGMELEYRESDGTSTLLQEAPISDSVIERVSKKVSIGDNEFLIFSLPANEIISATWSSIAWAVVIAVFSALISTFVIWRLMRRDLLNISALISSANTLSEGGKFEPVPKSGTTEIDDLAVSLDLMVYKLQESRQDMRNFLSDASHELRTPLTVIRGYLEILQNNLSSVSEQASTALNRASSEALRMQRIINNILSLSELEQLPNVEIESVSVTEIIRDQLNDFQALDPKRKVSVKLDQSSRVTGSTELLTQLFANIFSNIRIHTPEGSPVKIESFESSDDVIIRISDSGPGIPKLSGQQNANGFPRFNTNRSRNSGGSGLGLSIMQRIAELIGAKLILNNLAEGGLQVEVILQKAKKS